MRRAPLPARVCTFVLAWRVFDSPVVVAANRDETLDRPADPPGAFARDPLVVAPRDREAGGTWIGYNECGVLAGITNRWGVDRAGERSRGLLVGDALGEPSAAAATETVRTSVAAHEYAGFNLVVADADSAVLLEYDGTLRERCFEPGVHVVVNVGADDGVEIPDGRADAGRRQARGVRRAREELHPEDGETADGWLNRAAEVLADHDYGFCVHGDGFGTRSSSLIAVGDDPEYRFVDGPPCRGTYRPIDGI